MSKTNLGPGKKRYMFTLTEAQMERTQALMKELKLPAAMLSSLLDEAVGLFEKQLTTLKNTGGFTMRDLFSMVGEQMESLEEETTKINEGRKTSDKNRKEAPGRSKIAKRANQS